MCANVRPYNKTNNHLLFLIKNYEFGIIVFKTKYFDLFCFKNFRLYPFLPPPPLYTVWESFSKVWDVSHYSMGHISLQYGTSLYLVWDIYLYSMVHLSLQCRNISLQYGTSLYLVWDIYLYSMVHLSLQCRNLSL